MSLSFYDQSFPSIAGKAVTKSDETIIEARSLYVGTGGTVVVQWENGDTSTFLNVLSGTILPVNVVKVMDATTASNIIALK